MALSRRSGQRFQASIWPGFVDAMTGLLMVLMFVLTIFSVVQFVLRDTITGQETELGELSAEVSALAGALGLAQDRSASLSTQVSNLTGALSDARTREEAQQALINTLEQTRTRQDQALSEAQAKITGFEAQVAGLLADQAQAQTDIGELSEALTQARDDIDAGAEAARLAAARREALEARIADLQGTIADQGTALSDAEAAKLADAAAAEALRTKLKNSDAELTAMTLALEAKRKEAEETLTLLAAARAAKDEVAATLADREAQLSDAAIQAALLATAQAELSEQEKLSLQSQRQATVLNEQVAALRGQVASLQNLLNLSTQAEQDAQVQITSLGEQLNTALARVAVEQRERARLEEAERIRLQQERDRLAAEAKDLERYKSDFFGQLRDLVGNMEGVRIEGDRFVFSSEVLFTPGQAILSPDGQAQIANIAGILRQISGQIPDGIDWIIRVDGHTDNLPLSGRGEFRDNWELSQARALSVVRYMIDTQDIAPNRLSANGFGEYRPIAMGDSDQARTQNRRIELKLTER